MIGTQLGIVLLISMVAIGAILIQVMLWIAVGACIDAIHNRDGVMIIITLFIITCILCIDLTVALLVLGV